MAEIELKNGYITSDPRLDRIPQFDEKSREFPIRALVAQEAPVSKLWNAGIHLDQGQEGACVGFSWSGELACDPVPVENISNEFARQIYHRAQYLDEWPGEAYEGTSVLAGVKAIQERGFIGEYRWAFGIDDLILALGHHGPAVLGVAWYDSMMQPRPSGLMEVSPGGGGGHAILARGIHLQHDLPGEGALDVIRFRNSWGPNWGDQGDCYIKIEDLEGLLKNQGEACIPVQRNLTAAV